MTDPLMIPCAHCAGLNRIPANRLGDSPRCGPCKAFAPTYQQAAAQLQGRCRLGKLDSEANRQLAGQLNIRSIPTLILFKGGVEIARQSGALPLPQLLGWLKSQGIA
ncbi:thioredoxin family protein [Metapseudomonas otitidis]|uniref:thioredoxin family protein n=1 Tax=Metapseudomonas otitidis TaxID=319939 RepID=UPI001CA3C395|nr:thioredoxin family protein [Pseudomonas otitidis]QZX82722.1 thioredoxin family protein [Pseudomonas otitidis]